MKINRLVLISFFVFFTAHAGEFLDLKIGQVKLPNSDNTNNTFFQKQNALPNVLYDWHERQTAIKNFVIQFNDKITQTELNILQQMGATTVGYLPQDALIVQASSDDLEKALLVLKNAKAISEYKPEWKVDPEIFLPQTSGDITQTDIFHIRTLSANNDLEVTLNLKQIPGLKIKDSSERSFVIETEYKNLGQISKIEGIEWIQKMPIFLVLDFFIPESTIKSGDELPPYTGYESGTKVMGFEKAYELGLAGHAQIAAVADTGADSGDLNTLHPDLAQIIKGYPMGPWNTSWADPMGHGTHVAGSIVGNGKMSSGKIHGGAYEANLIAEGMWNTVINNLFIEPDFNKLMGTPYSQGARIHSNSWGSALSVGVYDSFAAKADDVMWKYSDLLVVFAAGNSGADLDKNGVIDLGTILSPATAKNVLAVGASENFLEQGGIQKRLCDLKNGQTNWGVEPLCSDTLSNNPNGIAAFSSRGPTKDGRIKPDIVSPGTNIVSVRSKQPTAQKLWGEYDENYLYSGGTSMATPLTAGAAVVTRQFLVEKLKQDNPSAALIKAAMLHTAKELYPGQYGTGPTQEIPQPRPNAQEGYGRVDLETLTTLEFANAIIVDDKIGVGTQEETETEVSIHEGETLQATLVYTDAPAIVSAQKALVNDLDLSITNGSQTYQLQDRTNNTEMLELKNLSSVIYKVKVKGVNVPQGKNGKLPYALVISHKS
ncbi:MAG: S8 family serine peptidase [Deltaproteobacteria bacterium]|nr:S8 family serine peptidase [Deltaproteobacteria bacterium]